MSRIGHDGAEDGAVSPNVEQNRDATTVVALNVLVMPQGRMGMKEQVVETRASLWPKLMIVARLISTGR